MTAQELRKQINDLETPPPKQMEVDADTYGHVCQEIFDWHQEATRYPDGSKDIPVRIGINNGIFFKGIELILMETK